MNELSQLRQLQLAELDILKEVVKICDKYSLRYFMIGGTMLGAIRHKGFIPWDDDIDIALPQKDYELFLKYATEELPHPYKVLTSYGKHPCLYAKVHNVNTTFVEAVTVNYPEYYKGVFIDVMCMCGMPSTEEKRKVYCKKVGGLVKALNWHKLDFKSCTTWKSKLLYLIPESWFFRRWKKLTSQYDFDDSEYTCFSWSHRPKRLMFPTSILRRYSDYDFETVQVKGAKDFDSYLSIHFNNDYMQLPPEAARQTHSGENAIIDLKNGYETYLEKGEQK